MALDQSFINMLVTGMKNNVDLNSEKLQFEQEKINFYGHILTEKGIQHTEDKTSVDQEH